RLQLPVDLPERIVAMVRRKPFWSVSIGCAAESPQSAELDRGIFALYLVSRAVFFDFRNIPIWSPAVRAAVCPAQRHRVLLLVHVLYVLGNRLSLDIEARLAVISAYGFHACADSHRRPA